MKTKLLLMLLVVGLVAGAAQANMLVNPSFEDGAFSANDPPEDWTDSSPAWTSNMTWYDDAAGAHSGSKYIKMNMWLTTGATAWVWQTVDVTPGQEYAFSIWAKSPIAGEQAEVWGYYEWLDVASAIISGGWLEYWDWVEDDWEHAEFGTEKAPASATQVIFYLAGIPENGAVGVLFDDAYMDFPLPSFPSPAWEATVPIGDVDLSWTNMEPNNPGGPVFVDVWFGTDPNNMAMQDTVPVSGENVTTVTVSAPDPDTYYWQVNSYIYGDPAVVDYDNSDPNAFQVLEGHVWSFNAVSDTPPSSVDAGIDLIAWSGYAIQLDPTVDDDGVSALTYLWTAAPADGVAITEDGTNPDNTATKEAKVTITKGPYSAARIVNAGFEDPVSADGAYAYLLGYQGWGQYGNEWQGVRNPLPAYYGGNAPEGQNIGWAEAAGTGTGAHDGFAQVLAETLQPSTTYTLTVEVGHPHSASFDGYPFGGYRVQLLAGGTPHNVESTERAIAITDGTVIAEEIGDSLSIAEDTFATVTVTHTTGASAAADPNVGEVIQIRLLATSLGGAWSMTDFDDVVLTADPPFPATPDMTVKLTLGVNDEANPMPVTDTMTIDVYDDECKAARYGVGLAEDNPGDINKNCITGLDDLAEMLSTWLDDTGLTEAVPK